MNTTQRGFGTLAVIVVFALILAGGGAYLYQKDKYAGTEPVQSDHATTTPVTAPHTSVSGTLAAKSGVKRLSDNYQIEDGRVFYYSPGKIIRSRALVAGADPDTFQVLNRHFTKDKDHVFIALAVYENDVPVLEGADPNTFSIVKDEEYLPSISKDKTHVFCDSTSISTSPQTFRFIRDSFATDGTSVFMFEYSCKALVGIDQKTFEPIQEDTHGRYFKDKNGIYAFVEGTELHEIRKYDVDTASFALLGLGLGKDTNNVYMLGNYGATVVPSVSPSGFRFIGNSYFSNNEHVYRLIPGEWTGKGRTSDELQLIPGADPSSFTAG